MRLSGSIMRSLEKAGVSVFYADRSISHMWNKDRAAGEPIFYGGWYWHQTRKGRVIYTDEEGPFRSEMAAYRDAYVKLQLRPE